MTRKPFKIVFKNPKKLSLLAELRKEGWGYSSIAMVFGVDHSSIYHECKKFNFPKGEVNVEFGLRTIIKTLGIKSKRVKTYADYLREAGYKKPRLSQELLRETNI